MVRASTNVPSRHRPLWALLASIVGVARARRLACRFTVGFWSAYLKFVGGLLCIDNTPPSTNGSALGEVEFVNPRPRRS